MRLIDADEFYRILENKSTMDEVCLLSHTFSLKELAYILHNQPTVEERPKGKWIMHIDDLFPEDSMQECSNCHEYQYLTCDDNYCPNCGADMRGEENE